MTTYNEDYRISELIAKQLAGVISENESLELTGWVEATEEHRKLYLQILDAENLLQRQQYVEDIDMVRPWNMIRRRIVPPVKNTKFVPYWLKIAACLICLLSVGGGLFYYWHGDMQQNSSVAEIVAGSSKAVLITDDGRQIVLQDSLTRQIRVDEMMLVSNDGRRAEYHFPDRRNLSLSSKEPEIKYNTIVIPRGGEYELQLSDGTRIWLNSDSELRFPVCFTGNSRMVSLKGEAYFEVAKDHLHPFIVNACGKMDVEVLGTEFNIQAYPEEVAMHTTLNQGRVKVSGGMKSMELNPGQQAVYDLTQNTMQLRNVKADSYSAWKDGKMIFEDERLESIMNRLARWYDITVFYQNNSVKDFHFTGDLEKYDDFQTTLKMIERATQIKFEISGKNVVVNSVK